MSETTVYESEYLDSIPSGRRRIYSDTIPETPEEVLKIINQALTIHEKNRKDIKKLIMYYLGVHDIYNRAPNYSSDVNNKLSINYSQSITRDIVGYTFGKDIEYVQKNIEDSEKVRELVSILEYINAPLEDEITATYCSICGVGYECALASDDYLDDPEAGIKISHLNPLNTFAVYSHEINEPVILTCTYYTGDDGITRYGVFTKDKKYVIHNLDKKDIEDLGFHGFKDNPITVFENNHFLTGDYETALTILDAIDKVSSDSINDIENFVQSLLVFINATLGDDEDERDRVRKQIKENRIIEIKSPQGMNADAKYITQQLNPETTKALREYLEESLWKVVGIPDRKTRGGGGGDTGDAVKLRDGWADLEVLARNKEKFFRKGKRQQLSIILDILSYVNDKLANLKARNIEIKFSRNKNDNLSTKAQAYSTLIATETLDPRDALDIVDITTNVNEIASRGEKYFEKYYSNYNLGGTNGNSNEQQSDGNTDEETEVPVVQQTASKNR